MAAVYVAYHIYTLSKIGRVAGVYCLLNELLYSLVSLCVYIFEFSKGAQMALVSF